MIVAIYERKAASVIKATDVTRPQYVMVLEMERISEPTREFSKFMTVEKKLTWGCWTLDSSVKSVMVSV